MIRLSESHYFVDKMVPGVFLPPMVMLHGRVAKGGSLLVYQSISGLEYSVTTTTPCFCNVLECRRQHSVRECFSFDCRSYKSSHSAILG